ncbi:MAG: hypothetical protein MK135_11080 [Polyangiaceae bacterium]|nr:hypothetical protein [Polyangiaceae bacterium]
MWQALIDLEDWQWNQWTRLKTDHPPQLGVKGKLHASYDGNDEWKIFPFEFGEVNEISVIAWSVTLWPSSGSTSNDDGHALLYGREAWWRV